MVNSIGMVSSILPKIYSQRWKKIHHGSELHFRNIGEQKRIPIHNNRSVETMPKIFS